MQLDVHDLVVDIDDASGQLRSIHDRSLDRRVIAFEPGSELELNGVPVDPEPIEIGRQWGCPLTRFDLRHLESYIAGARYRIHRLVVPGTFGNGRGRSVHLRYSIRRVPWGDWKQPGNELWEHPIETPQSITSFAAPCAPMQLFSERTHVRSIAIGGSGPREHVSIEDAPYAEALPYLQNPFRTTFPGQATVPGALYYDPEDERWVWIVVHHPTIGGDVRFGPDGQAFRFTPFKPMEPHDRLVLPDISIYYGQGLDEADALLANLFDRFREPPDWWYRTTWFWLHPLWVRDHSFHDTRAAVDHLMDDCGVTGFGLICHDRLPASLDCECESPRASAIMGGDDALRDLVSHIKAKGGHTYTWMARYGKLAGGGPDVWRDDWALQGIDGRPVGHEQFHICDAHGPGWRAYLRRWLTYYVRDIGIDGIFWDSAFQPMVANFSTASRDWLNCPGEAMAGAPTIYQELYDLGRRLNPDFFMWGEGINNDCPMNAFAVDNRTHGEHSGHRLMQRIAHAGPRRLVWRSAFCHDVSGAFPFLQPVNDVGASGKPDFYREVASDPMNRWLCRTVAERGCRQARGIADGIAVLDEFLVVGADERLLGRVVVPAGLVRGSRAIHEISGSVVEGSEVPGGTAFDLTETGAWRMA